MARLGIHKRGHGLEKMLGQSVAHKKPRDLHTGDQMEPHPMTSEVHPDISSLAGPDMSGQASTKGSPYMGGMSVDSSGTTAAGGLKKGGSANWIQSAIKKPGSLKKSLHVKAEQKIPAKKLAAAAKKPGVMGRRARLAETLRSLKK